MAQQQDFTTPSKDSFFESESIGNLRISVSDDTATTAPLSEVGTPSNGLSSSSQQGVSDRKWESFYKETNTSPLKAARSVDFDETIAKANEWLEKSKLPDFEGRTFYDLTDEQKYLLVLMIVKRMDEDFAGLGKAKALEILVNVLREDSLEYKRMMSFVRLGGDKPCLVAKVVEKSYGKFVTETDRKWNVDERVITIMPKRVVAQEESIPRPPIPKDGGSLLIEPYVCIQMEESCVCTFAACASLLYYCFYLPTHHTSPMDQQEINSKLFKMNVSRYIRDEIPGRMIANLALTDKKGESLTGVLHCFLKSFGCSQDAEAEKIMLFPQDEGLSYDILAACLGEGRPIVLTMEVIPTLTQKGDSLHGRDPQVEFIGKAVDHYTQCEQVRPEKQSDRTYHALLCIGIRPRTPSKPPLLLVQDSCAKRPFFCIGLDLLLDMGRQDVKFYMVPEQWKFREKLDYVMDPETKPLMCGSPMSMKESGTVYVLDDEPKPEPLPDMSRYLMPADTGILMT